MAYHCIVDHKNKEIHFAIFTSKEEFEKGGYIEWSEDEWEDSEWKEERNELGEEWEQNPKKRITRLLMMRLFLKETSTYFSVNNVSEMLKLSRKTLDKSVWMAQSKEEIKNKYSNYVPLPVYNVKYYFAPRGTGNQAEWKPEKPSNIVRLVYAGDLYQYLLKIISSGFTYRNGASLLSKVIKGKLEDEFYRNGKASALIEQKDFVCFLRHQHSATEIEELAKAVVEGRAELHSSASLKEITGKSDTTFKRLLKCMDTVRVNLSGSGKESPRFIFYVNRKTRKARDNEIATQTSLALDLTVDNKVKVIPMQLDLNNELEEREFDNPVDYLSLYIKGYKKLPSGYYVSQDGGRYFAVDASETKLKGLNIEEELNKRIAEEEAIKQAVQKIQEGMSLQRKEDPH